MRPSRFPLFTSLALILVAWATPVSGQAQARVASEDWLDLLRGHVEQGTRLAQGGQHEQAAHAFAAAYALEPAPLLLFNLAQVYRKAGHDREALVLFGRYLQQEPRGSLRAEAEGYRSQARKRLLAQGGPGWQEDADQMGVLESYLEKGRRAAQEGQHEQAALAFATAYALESVPPLLFNLAQVQRKAKHYRETLALYGRFLRAAPQSELRREAEDSVTEVKARLSERQEAERQWATERQREKAARRREEAKRRVPLRAAKWAQAAIGLAGVIAGATLWGLNGHPKVSNAGIELALDGQTPGILLVSAGGALLGSSGVLFGIDYRRDHSGAKTTMLTLSGGF